MVSWEKPASDSDRSESRLVRVFISSTFRDMHSEREELVKITFPELRKRCGKREIELTEVDLRWGVTDEQAAEGKVLPICLAEIERCQPYFIGLLGERYGYVPREINLELMAAQPWLDEHKEKSITELEILHGVLKNPEMKKLSFFYFRDPESSRQVETQLTQRNDYQPEPESSLAKLKSLKDEIRSNQNSYPVPVREDYPDAKTLGKMILEDLWKVIDERFPREEVPTAFEKERLEHEAFAAARRKVYIGREEYFYKLDEHAAGHGPPLIILGESGSGKSALIANWVEKYQKEHPDHFIVSHFVGSSAESTDYLHMLYRIIKEIKQRYEPAVTKIKQGFIDEQEEQISLDPKKVIEDFHLWLNRAAGKGKFVLILEGLNRLEDRDSALGLGWLPDFLPQNVRLVISTLPDHSLASLETRNWHKLTIQPLQSEEGWQFIVEYLAQYRKSLSKTHVDQIVSSGQSSNPLYLRTLLEELRVFGIYEELGRKIEHYLKAVNIEDLFKLVLQRLEGDYEKEKETKGMVKNVMSMLWASRRGLSESELLEMLGTNGKLLPQAYWSPLYLALEESLISRAGLLNFFHDFLRNTVENRYLTTAEKKRAAHNRIADYFEVKKSKFRHFIDDRKMDELPWQLRKSEQWVRLKDCITDMEMFFTLSSESRQYELKEYWLALGNRFDLVESCKSMIDEYEKTRPTGKDLSNRLNAVAHFLKIKTRYKEAESLYKRALDINEKLYGGDNHKVTTTLNNLAGLYRTQGRYIEAERLLKRGLEILERFFGKDNLNAMDFLNDLALMYAYQGRYDEAEPFFRRVLEIREKRLGKYHLDVAISLNNLAALYDAQGLFAKVEILYRRALDINERALGKDHIDVSLLLNNLGTLYHTQGQYEKAESFYRRALKIREKVLGAEHPEVALTLNNLAALYRDRGLYSESEQFFKRALEIRERIFGKNHTDVATSLNNLADLYYAQCRYVEAELLYKRSIKINETILGKDHINIAYSLGNLAAVYHAQGRYVEAEPLFKQALELSEMVLGSDHPNVARSLNNLATLYEAQGRHDEAEPLHRRALEIREKALGKDHPKVASSLNNLAEIYHHQGKLEEAELFHKRALEIRENVLGNEHPDVAISLNNLAALYNTQEKFVEAEPLYKQALEIRERIFGKDHPSIALFLNNLAALYYALNRFNDSEQLLKRALEIRERALGKDHLDVAVSLNDLATLYEAQGRHDEAGPLLKRIQEIRKRVQDS